MKQVLATFSLVVLVVGLCSCEQIVNGDFATGSLSPGWSACSTPSGGVTDENWCFNAEYNLELTGYDCFQQDIVPPATPAGPLTFWAACPVLDRFPGKLYAEIRYSDGTSDTVEIARTLNCDTQRVVPVDYSKQVSRVTLYTMDADASWFISRVSLMGS